MDIESILQDLRHERGRLDAAISALEGGGTARRGRLPKGSQFGSVSHNGRRRTMSAAARAKIAAAQRARWAKQKGEAAPKKAAKKSTAAKKSSGRRHMSAAARKRISEKMKAAWAARKKAA